MAQRNIGVGAQPNDGTGDPLRTAFTKANDNFTEIYAALTATVAGLVGASAAGPAGPLSVAQVKAILALAVADIVGAAPLASPHLTGTPIAPTPAANDNSTKIATTAYLDRLIAAANGVASLDSGGKLSASQIPASLVGAVQYQGVWNASTNSPALVSSTGTKGQYYKVSTAGTTAIDGVSQWNVGDTIIFDGTVWDKIDGIANEVVSVAGLVGAITAAALKTALAIASTDVSGLGTAATKSTGTSGATVPLLNATNTWSLIQIFAGLQMTGVAFSALPASPGAGMVFCVTDSTVNTWGATVAGGGSNKVLAWYNGAHWTVFGI